MDMSKTLSDLPMDLHRLILSHDEEKIELKKENEKLKTRVKMLQCLLDEARQDSDSDEDTDDEQENDEQKTYTTNALLYGKNHNLKYWQCIGTGTNGKVTLPNMIALKKSCTCHFCGYVEEDSKQSDQLVCGCNVCNLPLCDHCRATDGEDDVDDSICQACYDKSKEEEDE